MEELFRCSSYLNPFGKRKAERRCAIACAVEELFGQAEFMVSLKEALRAAKRSPPKSITLRIKLCVHTVMTKCEIFIKWFRERRNIPTLRYDINQIKNKKIHLIISTKRLLNVRFT